MPLYRFTLRFQPLVRSGYARPVHATRVESLDLPNLGQRPGTLTSILARHAETRQCEFHGNGSELLVAYPPSSHPSHTDVEELCDSFVMMLKESECQIVALEQLGLTA